jgi:hypothetical protein
MDVSQRRVSLNVENVPVAEAISSVAAALIAHTLSSQLRESMFVDWYRDKVNDPSISRVELVRDLTAVQEALSNLGITFP